MVVVQPGWREAFEAVAAFEVHADAPPDGGMAEDAGEEGLADPDRSHVTALWPAATKRSEHSSFQMARS